MNKTSPTVVANPERAAYLFWINDGIAATREDQVGPAIALQVDKGDSLSLETWAKFEKKPNYTRNATTGMLADLLGSVFVNAAYGLETATQAKQIFNTNLSAALGGTGADPATRPYAYLNYLVFDNNYVVKDGGAWRVPDNAGFDPGMEISVTPQQVKFPSYIKPQQKGYIYIWVSNESENTKVWFDDLKVTHTKSRVVQASDYYAWGSTMREQRTPENPTYRYGYQGEYAEKDLETGWNHFELREYDGVVGRWTSTDPYRQYWSPYVGMGNNSINGVDPDGGFDTKRGARWYAFWNGGGDIEQAADGKWYVGKQVNLSTSEAGIQYNRTFDWGIDAKFNVHPEVSIGSQFGSHTTGWKGVDINFASWTIIEFDMNFSYTSKDGWNFEKPKVVSHIFDSKMKQHLAVDIPGFGASISQERFMRNANGSIDTNFNVHAGLPGFGGNNEYNFETGQWKFFNGGSVGRRAGVGGDLSYSVQLKVGK